MRDPRCQYFAPKGGEFLEVVQKWEAEGLVARWGEGRLGEISCAQRGAGGPTQIDWSSFQPNDVNKARARPNKGLARRKPHARPHELRRAGARGSPYLCSPAPRRRRLCRKCGWACRR